MAEIESQVASLNQNLASFETIKTFRIVPEFTIANGLLTPTMKLRKSRIVAQYKGHIDGMYAASR